MMGFEHRLMGVAKSLNLDHDHHHLLVENAVTRGGGWTVEGGGGLVER